jgi:hypothetical protein
VFLLAPVLAVLLAAPSDATARDVPLPPPPSGTVRRPAAPAPVPPRTPAPAPPVRFAGTLGFDFGFTELLEVELTDGSSRSITANQGVYVSLGIAVPHLGGRLETQATIGLKYSGIEASNGSANYLVFPLEVLEAVNVAPVRLAAGLVYLPRPSTSGDGVLAGFDVQFESSLGVVLQAEWVIPSRRGRVSFGPRFVWQKLQVRGGGPVIDANAFGAVMSFSL